MNKKSSVLLIQQVTELQNTLGDKVAAFCTESGVNRPQLLQINVETFLHFSLSSNNLRIESSEKKNTFSWNNVFNSVVKFP